MWRRFAASRFRRRSVGTRRARGMPMSYAGTVLLVGGAILLVLYLTGRLTL
jgi:hypothetical protein